MLNARTKQACSYFGFSSLFGKSVNARAAYDLPDVRKWAVFRVHRGNTKIPKFHPAMTVFEFANNIQRAIFKEFLSVFVIIALVLFDSGKTLASKVID